MQPLIVRSAILATAIAVVSCAAPSGQRVPQQTGRDTQASAPQPAASKTLTMVVRYEVTELAAKVVAGGPSAGTKRAYNAALAMIDSKGAPRPYLADTLPQLNSDTWRVLPDSTMETTYRLKPNLTWHDGQPLTADDFAFAFRVYTAPGVGAFISKPQDQIESISAPDPRTLVIRWKSLYPEAGTIQDGDLDALPRHILESTLDAHLREPASQDVLMGVPFWSTQFIGPGPYKLDKWEPGSSIQGVAFDGHALGRPKIERFVVKPIPDENTAMTNLLADSADLGVDNSLRFEHAMELRRQWEAGQRGTALLRPGTRHHIVVQHRPDFLKATALADLRVRRALMHAIDRQVLNDALFENQGLMSEHFIPREMSYYPDVERAITKYPFDPQRVLQLMGEAGFHKDGSGFFVSASGERFRPENQTDGGGLFEREQNLIQDMWSKVGIEIRPNVLPAVQVRNNEARNTFPDLYTTSTGVREAALNIFATSDIGTPASRWAGNNRGAWSNPEYDRLWAEFNVTLDRSERVRYMAEMMKLVSEEVPGWPLYWDFNVMAFPTALRGPELGLANTSTEFWSIHEWELR